MKQVDLKFVFVLNLVFLATQLSAQIGGKQVFKFLDLPSSPRITALGGNLISTSDEDLSIAWNNPALINSQMNGRVAINYNFHLAGINTGYIGYADSLAILKSNLVFGLNFSKYGDFVEADEFGNKTGQFSANEYAFHIGASRQLIPHVQVGLNMKIITSRLESYKSLGLGFDAGVYYEQPEKLRSWALVIRNIGSQITPYQDGPVESIPFDIQLGFSKSFKYLPFRISAIFHHLHRWNLLYDLPDTDTDNTIIGFDDPPDSRINMIVDNIFRHIIISGEFTLGQNENLAIRFGYNHLREKRAIRIPLSAVLQDFLQGSDLR